MSDMPDLTTEQARLLGVREGLIHAAVIVGSLRGRITGPANAYLPPRHHTRLRAEAMMRVNELTKAIDALHGAIRDMERDVADRRAYNA